MTSAINTSTNPIMTAAAKAKEGSAADTQDRFLTLLIAQMKAQDPMNPMDNGQMTSQMAQLSTVSGIEKLNTAVANMSNALLSNQVGQGAALLDKHVIAEGNTFSINDGKGMAGFELGQAADVVRIDFIDATGRSVKDIEMKDVDPGTTAFNMADYNLPDGKYYIRVNATGGQGMIEDVTPLVQTRVKNLIPSIDSGFQLGLENDSVIGMDKIRLVQSV